MKKLSVNIGIITLLFIAALFAARFAYSGSIRLSLNEYDESISADSFEIKFEPEGICETEKIEYSGGRWTADFKALKSGSCDISIYYNGIIDCFYTVDVDFMNSIHEDYTYYTDGIPCRLLILSIYITLLIAAFIVSYFIRKKDEMYSYSMIFTIGITLFLFFACLVSWLTTAASFRNTVSYDGRFVVDNLLDTVVVMTFISLPVLAVFSIFLVASNLSLVRHEGMAVRNLLGVFLAILLIGGCTVGCIALGRDLSGSDFEVRMHETISEVYSAVFIFAECMLLGASICSLSASRMKLGTDLDYIIILGCGIKPDGTLYPLLKGRVDNAVRLYRNQLEKNGKAAMLLPSGGQGPDEVCSEAEAMRRYLLTQGIPEEHILIENKSTTTLENMKFSKAVIEADSKSEKNPKIAFSTTNYHVFRSGVWSVRAGLKAVGSGSKTKWYFWPNALLRELAGLFAEKWKQILLFCLIIIVILVLMIWMY